MSWLTTPNVVALPDDQTSPISKEMSRNINAPIVSYIPLLYFTHSNVTDEHTTIMSIYVQPKDLVT